MKTNYLKPLVKLPRSLYKILSTAQYSALRIIANKNVIVYNEYLRAGRVISKTDKELFCRISPNTLTVLRNKQFIKYKNWQSWIVKITPKGRAVLKSVLNKIPV